MPKSDYDHIRLKKLALRAEGYLELDMAEHALAEIQRASQQNINFSPNLLYLEGASLFQLKKYRDALYPLGQAVLLEPTNIKLWLLIGSCQKRIGRCDLAIESLENALMIQPNSPVTLYNLACYQALAKHPNECLKFLRQAIHIDPKYRELVRKEHSFDPYRNLPEFQKLMGETSPATDPNPS
ncbi:MAG: hypothetical protein Q4D98_07590 [Planctomycetia bacterium]|nr:hypothetical protein [Planctomycetia bacterium]